MKLALGTVQFGMKYGLDNKQIPKEEVFEILKYAYENGIDTLDTAEAYGDSEQIIGKFIEENKIDFKIVSKLAGDKNVVQESLDKLKVNELYGYLIHDFDSFLGDPKVFDVLKEFRAQGTIKKIGFSLYYPREVEYLLENNIDFDIVQVPYSVLDQRFAYLFPKLKEKGIEIHVRSVFLQGLLFRDPDKLNKNFSKIKNKLSVLRKQKIPLSALFINFAALNPYINKVVIGVHSLDNLKDNILALKYQNKVKNIYADLINLKEEDENIILPFNWSKK